MGGYIILGIVALFVAVVAIRTALFRPKAQPPVSEEAVEFDRDKAISALAELIEFCQNAFGYDSGKVVALTNDGATKASGNCANSSFGVRHIGTLFYKKFGLHVLCVGWSPIR